MQADGTLSKLKKTILEKSAGVFSWVSSAPRAVIDQLNQGNTTKEALSQLDAVSPELWRKYLDMLDSIIKPERYKDAYFLLSWTIKAVEPMFLSDLASNIKFSRPFDIDTEILSERYKALVIMGLFVGSNSGGLMETKCYDPRESSSKSIAIFIHHTVRIFLRDIGMERLRGKLLPAQLRRFPKQNHDMRKTNHESESKDNIGCFATTHSLCRNNNQTQRRQSLPCPNMRIQRMKKISMIMSRIGMCGIMKRAAGILRSIRPLMADRWFDTFDR